MSTPTLALREAARLINVWASHNHEDTTSRALAQWAAQTASLTPHLPQPRAGLDTLLLLDLAAIAGDGSVRASDVLRTPAEHNLAPDNFAPALRILILERLLRVADCAELLRDAFGYAKLVGSSLNVQWHQIPPKERVSPAWIWLQEMGLAEHDGQTLKLADVLRPFVVDAEVRRTKISQEELEARIAAQRERAWLAEDLVVKLERDRLNAAGAAEYGELVRRVSVDDALAGFDVESYELSGSSRFIEVKCSAGPRDRFYLSRSERDTAERLGSAYWIAWVGWASRLPSGQCDIAWFRDPASVWTHEKSPWRLTMDTTVVELVGNDLAFVAKP